MEPVGKEWPGPGWLVRVRRVGQSGLRLPIMAVVAVVQGELRTIQESAVPEFPARFLVQPSTMRVVAGPAQITPFVWLAVLGVAVLVAMEPARIAMASVVELTLAAVGVAVAVIRPPQSAEMVGRV